jgi:hypothetical protein
MTQPELLFTMRLNKARHDKDFQRFLSRCFGQRYSGYNPTNHQHVEGYLWRETMYVTKILEKPPQPPSK